MARDVHALVAGLGYDRKIYAAELARPDHVRAGMEWFRALDEDAKEFHDHWLMEEAPGYVILKLVEFLSSEDPAQTGRSSQ